MKINPVRLVTIKKKVPLFKGDISANAIEIIQMKENGFEIVAQKELYEVGDTAVYIEPDYCLSDIPLFESYIRPRGNPKKSRLGSNNRIRAIKFNLHRGDGQVVYSNGILIPYQEVKSYLKGENLIKVEDKLTELLGIKKWTPPLQPNSSIRHGASKPFPRGVYKTDETNINNKWNTLQYPITLVGHVKNDGSSISIGHTMLEGWFIASRNLTKPLTYNKVTGVRKPKWWERIKLYFYPKSVDLKIYEEVKSDSDFVKGGKPILNKMEFMNYENLILRGEMIGGKAKGSGNKNNPAKGVPLQVRIFGVDEFKNGVAIPLRNEEVDSICNILWLHRVERVFKKTFNSKEEIIEACEAYFKDNLVEGIVLRTLDSKWSAKFMNNLYDSKK